MLMASIESKEITRNTFPTIGYDIRTPDSKVGENKRKQANLE